MVVVGARTFCVGLVLSLLTLPARADDPTSFTFTRLKASPKNFSAPFITALGNLRETTPEGATKSSWQSRIDTLMTSAYVKPKITKEVFQKQTHTEAIDRAYAFIQANADAFDVEEKKYKIPRAAIASLFWIETKLGTYTGKHPVVEVFFALSSCDHSDRVESVFQVIRSKPELFVDEVTKLSDADLLKKIRARALKKVEWALGELKALDLLYQEDLRLGAESTRDVFSWKGSFAGAFGIGQFLPSSYRAYAVSAKNGQPDLFNPADAILSTGRFLSAQWGASASARSQALMQYNPLKAYGESILEITKGVEEMLAVAKNGQAALTAEL